MAGDRIKGITVEIGGDTQGLDKALKNVNTTSSKLQRELNDVQRLLKFDPNNVELMAQKQKLLTDQVANTEKKLQQLKNAEQQVQQQFEKGEIKVEQYRAFQRELADTQSYLRNTKNAVADLSAEQNNIQKSTKEMNRLLEVTGGTLDDFADAIGSRTVRAIQQGTASSKDLERAFDKIAQASLGAKTDVGKVRQEIEQLESGVKSVKKVSKALQELSQDAQESKGEVKDLGGELAGLVAGAGAGLGIGAIFEKAMDLSEVDTTIEISMDIPEESKQAVKDAIKTVGGYIGDNETALEGVRKQFQLNADLTDAENEKIVKGAGTISRAYAEVDFSELIQESYEMGKNMGITQEQALGMTKSLLDVGFPPEQLDIISEYGNQLSMAGYTAEEIQGIFASGIETGTWNIDNLMDGLKEGRIRLAEFGAEVPKAVQDTLKGTEISISQVQAWGNAMASGGEQGKQAMMDVAIALSQVENDTQRNALGTQLFGTLWEEQGKKITETIMGASEKTGNLDANQKMLNEDVAKLDSSPQQTLNQALQTLWTTLEPLLAVVTTYVTKVAEWIQQNPEITAGIIAFVSVIGILIGVFLVLTPIIVGLIGLSGTLGVTIGAIISPILIAIAIIGALIAIGVLLWKNWDTIVAKAKELATNIKKKFEEFKTSVATKIEETKTKVQETWDKVMQFFRDIDLKQIGKDIIQGLIDGIGSMARKVKQKAEEVANGIGEKIKSILKLGSPSKVMIGMGEDTGDGLAIGLFNKIGKVQDMSGRLAGSVTKTVNKGLSKLSTNEDIALSNYFDAIREDGDWLNDWLTHLPKDVSNFARKIGKAFAPMLENNNFEGNDAVSKYFKAIQEDGDWLNDWLTHMPKDISDIARQMGKALAPELEGTQGKFESIVDAIEKVTKASGKMGKNLIDSLSSLSGSGSALHKYFQAIQEDGDWLNDWLTHMPKEMSDVAREMGKIIAPSLEGREQRAVTEAVNKAKQLTVNIHSPKALDVRQASKEFNKTLNKMSLMW
jgi:phage-related minor tail protein